MIARISAYESFARNVKSIVGNSQERSRLLLNRDERSRGSGSSIIVPPDPETGVVPAASPARHEVATQRRDVDPRKPFGSVSVSYDEIVEEAVRDADADFNQRSRGGS